MGRSPATALRLGKFLSLLENLVNYVCFRREAPQKWQSGHPQNGQSKTAWIEYHKSFNIMKGKRSSGKG